MKTVEELAREAGFEVHERKKQVRVGIDALVGIDSTEKISRFRDLVLEEAAKVCDSVDNYSNPMTANDCAEAIRAMKGQK